MMESLELKYADSKRQQVFNALEPSYFNVDERDSRDRLAFVTKFAELVNYYDEHNQKSGNWLPFLVKDPALLLAVISKCDYQKYDYCFHQVSQQLIKLGWFGDNQSQPSDKALLLVNWQAPDLELQVFQQLFSLLTNLFKQINAWLTPMHEGIGKTSQVDELKSFFTKQIESRLANQLSQTKALQQAIINHLDKHQKAHFTELLELDEFLPELWLHSTCRAILPETKSLNLAWINHEFINIYHSVFSFVRQVVSYAESQFYQVYQQQNASPDTALLIAFTQLMEIQQKQINRFTGKHLDFYYQDILQQKPQAAIADKTVICLTLAKKIESVELAAGTQFKAGSYPDKAPIIFSNSRSQLITESRIKQVHPVYYQTEKLESSSEQKSAAQLFLGTKLAPDLLLKNSQKEQLSWPLFGNSLVNEAQSLEVGYQNKQISQGFAFASPMLFLQSGKRTITIDFHFEKLPAENYFSQSQFWLSSKSKWLKVIAKPVDEAAGSPVKNSLSVQINLSSDVPAVVPFDKHPDGIPSLWPQLKVLLSDEVNLTKPPQIKGVTITTEVEQFNDFVLGNKNGLLPPKKLGLLLGSIPEQQDSFYFGASECFAKPLTEIKLLLTWELPTKSFSTYYQQYNDYLVQYPDSPEAKTGQTFTNQAYMGAWSVLSNATWQELVISPPEKEPESNKNEPEQSENFFIHLGHELVDDIEEKSKEAFDKIKQEAEAVKTSWLGRLFSKLRFWRKKPEVQQEPQPIAQEQAIESDNNRYLFLNQASKTEDISQIREFNFQSLNYSNIDADPNLLLQPLEKINQAKNGYLSFELNAPTFAFGHELYSKVVAQISLDNAKLLIAQSKFLASLYGLIKKLVKGLAGGVVKAILKIINIFKSSPLALKKKVKTKLKPMPNLPISPKVSQCQVSYTATSQIDFVQSSKLSAQQVPFEFYHYGVFKAYKVFDSQLIPKSSTDKQLAWQNLIPELSSVPKQQSALSIPLYTGISQGACLYLGFDQLQANTQLSLYFELVHDANTCNNLASQQNNKIAFYFWQPLQGWLPLTILRDQTQALLCSGIVELAIPAELTENDELLPAKSQWLALSYSAKPQVKCTYLNTQAVELIRQMPSDSMAEHLGVLPPNSISATAKKQPKIASITQPFASFGGQAAEVSNDKSNSTKFKQCFYHRVSQRIRTKDRTTNCWDYELLAYQVNQDVFWAKCQIAKAGKVVLGLIKKYPDAQLNDAFVPAFNANELIAIQAEVQARSSAMTNTSVVNLAHKKVMIKASIITSFGLIDNAKQTLLLQHLNQQLRIYLSPWIASDLPQLSIEQGLKRASLIQFFTAHPDVKGVDSLDVYIQEQAQGNEFCRLVDDAIILPDFAILVSVKQHPLSIYKDLSSVDIAPITRNIGAPHD